MNKTLKDIKKNDRVQNQFALYYLLEYGKKGMLDDELLSKIKKEVRARDDRHSIITNEFAIGALDIARDMASLSHEDIYTFIYEDIRDKKRLERSR